MTAGVVAGWCGLIGLVLFVGGICAVIWDWSVLSNPDAPHGGPLVAIGIVLLIIAACAGLGQMATDVQDLKRRNLTSERCRPGPDGSNTIFCPATSTMRIEWASDGVHLN